MALLRFDNRFTAELPADPSDAPGSRQVRNAAFSRVEPLPAPAPRIVAWSPEVAAELGIGIGDDMSANDEVAQVFTGSRLLPGGDPYAMNYGGHQFGSWAGQLGDGRAIALGDVLDRHGRHQTLQLKGAGPTPYSRHADGLAVLRSSIREFLCSEAMHHLTVPTTRALSLAVTGNDVIRDLLYDGNPGPEPGAVVCRVAPSFLRFGNYQLPAARGEAELLKQLADFTIRHHFAHLGQPSPEVYACWFDEVCRTSCEMVVGWMRVGFVHGVMNTDNMSIHGLTIDYGPYGWLDDFDPDWTPNTTDAGGRRYRFGHQPAVTQWNLLQLANAIHPLVGEAEALQASINGFVPLYQRRYREMMLSKLGLVPSDDKRDDALIDELTTVLQLTETDMTIFFRRLAQVRPEAVDGASREADPLAPGGLLGEAFYDISTLDRAGHGRLTGWLDRYSVRARTQELTDLDRSSAMNRVNPRYVLRNYLAQEAIDAAEAGDYTMVNKLLNVLRHPYGEQAGFDHYGAKRPEWARNRPGCSMLSCSS